MTHTASVRISAQPDRIWALMSDVVHWTDWVPTITSVEPLGEPIMAVGGQYRLVQPRLGSAIWTVTAIDPVRSFSWETKSPGVRVTAGHLIEPEADGSATVRLTVEMAGVLARLAERTAGSLTQEYMSLEAEALKRTAESPSG